MKRVDYEELFIEDPYIPIFDGKLFTGIGFETDVNGRVMEETTYVNGKKEGKYQAFDYNGNVRCSGTYKDNFTEGKWVKYYENLVMEYVAEFDYKKEYPLFSKHYDQKGNLVKILKYFEFGWGVLDVFAKEQLFYLNGSLKGEKLYEFKILSEEKYWRATGELDQHIKINSTNVDYKDWKRLKKDQQKKFPALENPFAFTK